jgi:hypothetical protein
VKGVEMKTFFGNSFFRSKQNYYLQHSSLPSKKTNETKKKHKSDNMTTTYIVFERSSQTFFLGEGGMCQEHGDCPGEPHGNIGDDGARLQNKTDKTSQIRG